MKTHRQRRQTYLVLIPHRDVRLVLRKYSASLFRAGFDGAYFFPWVVPLAALSQPLTAEELKKCACALREASLAAPGGKMTSCEAAITAFAGSALLGPRLDIAPPSGSLGGIAKIACFFSPLIIGSCLLPSTDCDTGRLPPVPHVSFRSAAVANMILRPLRAASDSSDGGPDNGSLGYEWKIGKLVWLAAVRKRA